MCRNILYKKVRAYATAAFLIAFSLYFPIADAKVIGIVFDDSASMGNRFYLPSYGIQILLSTLDGERDKAFISRLSNMFRDPNGSCDDFETPYAYKVGERISPDNIHLLGQIRFLRNGLTRSLDIETYQKLERTIGEIASGFRPTKCGTPYEPLEKMVHEIVNETKQDEDAHLVVISDGTFTTQTIPTPDKLEQHYKRYKEQFKGRSITVHFVAIAPQKDDLAAMNEQQVRQNLLRVFNGVEANYGYHVVTDRHSFYEAMIRVVSMISGTDPLESGYNLAQTSVEMEFPFNVTKMIVLSPGSTTNKPARITDSESFDINNPHELKLQMSGRDQMSGWQGEQLATNVYHIDLIQGIEGRHNLNFDKAISKDIRILFRTDLSFDWKVHDSDGNPVPPNKSGKILLDAGKEYDVVAKVMERVNGVTSPVNLKRWRNQLEFFLTFTKGKQDFSEKMEIPNHGKYAKKEIQYLEPGTYTVSILMRYPGFILKRSKDLEFVVKVVNSEIEIASTPLTRCDNCKDGDIKVSHTSNPDFENIHTFEITANSTQPGDYEIDWSRDLPDGIQLTTSDGSVLARSSSVTIGANDTIRLYLQRNSDFEEEIDEVLTTDLIVSAKEPLVGRKSHAVRFIPYRVPATIIPVGHTLGANADDEPLSITAPQLAQREASIFHVTAEDPITTDQFTVSGGQLDYEVEVIQPAKPGIIHVRPKVGSDSLWCDCLVKTGDHQFTIKFNNDATKQQGDVAHKVIIEEVDFFSWLKLCFFYEGIVLLILLWLTHSLIKLGRMQRFPTTARLVESTPQGQDSTYPLRTGNIVLLKAINPFFFGSPVESSSVEGIRMTADRFGVRLGRHSGADDMMVVQEGQRLSAAIEESGQDYYSLNWGESLVDGKGSNAITYEFVDRLDDL